MIDIPTVTSKYGIINSVRKYKESKGNKNDCWNIALSLATGCDYEYIREEARKMGAMHHTGDGTIDSGYDRRLCDRIDGIYTKNIVYTPRYVETMTVEGQVKLLDPVRKYIIWCWRYKEKGKLNRFHHLMYSYGNEVWDDKKTRLNWFVEEVYEVRRINNEKK